LCEHCRSENASTVVQRTVPAHGEAHLDALGIALRNVVAARHAPSSPRASAAPLGAMSSRNPNGQGQAQRLDKDEVVTKCSVKSGPKYTPKGKIRVTTTGNRKSAPFSFAATFRNSAWGPFWKDADASCCEVRQYIKWDKAFHDYIGGPPHSGFPATATYDTWYEDRDANDKRYGHRTGPHSDPIAGGGDEYTDDTGAQDQASGAKYNGRDTPGGPTTMTGQFKFYLAAIDTCNADKVKARSPEIKIDW
jgi:hypothetical protein